MSDSIRMTMIYCQIQRQVSEAVTLGQRRGTSIDKR